MIHRLGRLFYRLDRLFRGGLFVILTALAGCGGSGGSDASAEKDEVSPDPDPPAVVLEPAFAGLTFNRPLLLLQPPSVPQRWYLIERAGRVLQFADVAAPVPAVMLDLRSQVDTAGEGGLLGMAFHPDFAGNGQVYLSYTAPPANTGAVLESRLSRFISHDNGLTLDPASEQVLLRLDQPFTNHNGGHIAFGPDGLLYMGLGDGGSAGDPLDHGQNSNTLFASLLRIDVDSGSPYGIPPDNPFAAGGGRGEIYALGLRNPWRWSFDRATGELWLGDVGENAFEEIDLIIAGGNYGWRIREGAHCFSDPSCSVAGLIDPVVEYPHSEGSSVTGGYVYRGQAVPGLRGFYLYGDFISGRIWALDPVSGDTSVLLDSALQIVSFAEDVDGELLVLDFTTGALFRVAGADR